MAVAAEPVTVTIATGRVGGLYYPVGGAICHLVNQNRRVHGITCTVDTTRGSVGNLEDLRNRSIEIALAQSDQIYNTVNGIGAYEAIGPFEKLRSLFAVYAEQFTIVSNFDADISVFADLRGKRVYLGGQKSGRRRTMQILMNAHGWLMEDVIDISEFNSSTQAEALCDNEFDAFVYSVGHPNAAVQEAWNTCDVVLAEVTGPVIDELIIEHPRYVSSVIRADLYRELPRDIPGIAVAATLVTTSDLPRRVAHEITRIFFENLEALRKLSPVFSTLSRDKMIDAALTAPMHPGAEEFLREAGYRKP